MPGFQLLEPAFKVLTAYENLEARDRARGLRLQLETQCDDDVRISRVSWCFSLFRNQRLRRHAAVEAAVADLIIICLGGDRLPWHVESWISGWPSRLQGTPGALVALLDPAAAKSRNNERLASYFLDVACKHGREFFCNLDRSRHHSRPHPLPAGRNGLRPPANHCLDALWRRARNN